MGVRNTLGDLSDHLFAELERLGDESLSGEALEAECARAKAIGMVAGMVISNANTALRARELASMDGADVPRVLSMDGGAPAALPGGGAE